MLENYPLSTCRRKIPLLYLVLRRCNDQDRIYIHCLFHHLFIMNTNKMEHQPLFQILNQVYPAKEHLLESIISNRNPQTFCFLHTTHKKMDRFLVHEKSSFRFFSSLLSLVLLVLLIDRCIGGCLLVCVLFSTYAISPLLVIHSSL